MEDRDRFDGVGAATGGSRRSVLAVTDPGSGSQIDSSRRSRRHWVSGRVAAAEDAARLRHYREGALLYPLRLIVVAVVLIPALLATPSPGLHGKGLGITLSLVVFVVGMLPLARGRQPSSRDVLWVLDFLCVGAAGIALAALQPQAAAELPASAAVLMAAIRLPPPTAALVGTLVTVGLGLAFASNSSGQDVAGAVLLCVVLGIVGALVRRSRLSQDRTELLLAELEDARDDHTRAAAVAERTRIAREIHDVLAHSLSGLSIQLEGARKLAANESASSELRNVIDRSAALAKQGLVEARSAVGALRDDDLTTVERLPALVEHYQRDIGLPVTLVVEGESRRVPPDVSLALYRVTDEALTNVTRHATGATTSVALSWSPTEIHLKVVDDGTEPKAAVDGSGGGWGLVGMRERVTLLGGRFSAGPNGHGWCVDVVVPV